MKLRLQVAVATIAAALVGCISVPMAQAHRPYSARAIDYFLSLQDPAEPTNGNNPPEWSGMCGRGTAGGDPLSCLNGDQAWEHPENSNASLNGAYPRAFLTDFDHNGTARSGSHSYQFRGSFVEFEDPADIFAEDWDDPECRTVRIRSNISAHGPEVDNPYPGSSLGWPWIWFDRQFLKKVSSWYDCGSMVSQNCRNPEADCVSNPAGWPSPERRRMDTAPASLSTAQASAAAPGSGSGGGGFASATSLDNPESEDPAPTSWCEETGYAEDYPSPNGLVTGDGSVPSGWQYDANDPENCSAFASSYNLTDNWQVPVVTSPLDAKAESTDLTVGQDLTYYTGEEFCGWPETTGCANYTPNPSDVNGYIAPPEAYAHLWRNSLAAAKTVATNNGVSIATDDYSWAGTHFNRLYAGAAQTCVLHTWWKPNGSKLSVKYCGTMVESGNWTSPPNQVTMSGSYSANGTVYNTP